MLRSLTQPFVQVATAKGIGLKAAGWMMKQVVILIEGTGVDWMDFVALYMIICA